MKKTAKSSDTIEAKGRSQEQETGEALDKNQPDDWQL